jgi:ABC-type uncharacterized transport system substrate-binding protein
MTNMGYVEEQILEKFTDDKVDLIFGFNTEVALEAKEAASGIGTPVVFANAFTEAKQPGEKRARAGKGQHKNATSQH